MDTDDVLVGRLLSRREVLGLFGIAGAALVVGCSDEKAAPSPTGAATRAGGGTATEAATAAATGVRGSSPTAARPSCVVVPDLTEGPFFVDEVLDRSDIRVEPSDGSVKDGARLELTFSVSRVGGDGSCTALAGARVDVWQTDAAGIYSGVEDRGSSSVGQTFLRGYQTTDAAGKASFTTIYPGWYPGRAVHIHFKIRTDDGYEFASQLFFEDALSEEVYSAGPPYADKGTAFMRNAQDGIFQQSGDVLTLVVRPLGTGYTATFDIGLQIA